MASRACKPGWSSGDKTGRPALDIHHVILVSGRYQTNALVHVNHRHHLTRAVGRVGPGAVKSPAGMKAYVAQTVRALLQAKAAERLLQGDLTLVRDLQIAAHLQPVALFSVSTKHPAVMHLVSRRARRT